VYQIRNLLVFGAKQKDALIEVGKQAYKGFQAIVMAGAQAPLREVVPAELREFLPKNIVVEVDEHGFISKITDRFENEHDTLDKKIRKMRRLVADYNEIAQAVKADLRNPDEMIKLSALVTAVIMETGIRPGKAGNGVVKVVNGEDISIETFGAVTLGPQHVKFIRRGFARLEFAGKKGGNNIAQVSDQEIVKILQVYVKKALKQGTPYIFVTTKGDRFTYTDLQRYFRERMEGVAPTDFRKLRATAAVLEALHAEQTNLYARIRGFATDQKEDLKERVAHEIAETLKAAIETAQGALSHESAKTTVRAYINPEVIFRFLSNASVDAKLEQAILTGQQRLQFSPEKFVGLAKFLGQQSKTASLQTLLDDLEESMDEEGVPVPKTG
jgi:integrase